MFTVFTSVLHSKKQFDKKLKKENKKMSDVKSFRITDELADKIREVAATLGGSQQGLTAMLNAYEMQASKEVLPTGISERVEELDGHLNSINRIFIDLTDAYNNCKQITKDQYVAQLQAKDMTIEELKGQINDLKEQISLKDAEKEKSITEVKNQLNEANTEIIKLQKEVVDLQKQLIKKAGEPAEENKKKPASKKASKNQTQE